MVWGAIAGLAGGLAGGLLGGGSGGSATPNKKKMLGYQSKWQSLLNERYPMISATLQERTDTVRGGFDSALRETSTIGEASRSRMLGREKEGIGAATTGLARRGLVNSSIFDQATRAIRDDTTRGLMDLDERLASLRAGLHSQGGQAVGNAMAGQAAFEQSATQDYADIYRTMMSYFGNVQQAPSQGMDMAGMGSIMSAISGMFPGS